jgi:multidrug efflux pump
MSEGVELIPATLEAVRLRLRPILMTSLAFGGGVLPLALATGAGSGSQNAIGTGVFGGMVTATALGLLFVPLFFVVVKRLVARRAAGGSRWFSQKLSEIRKAAPRRPAS